MAHPEELLAAALAVWGTRALKGGGAVPWALLEEAFETDLTGRTRQSSKTRVVAAGDGTTPEGWLAGLPKQGMKRLALAAPPDDAERGGARAGFGDKRMLHAFAGTGGVLLVAVGPRTSTALRTRVGRTPPTLLTKTEVFAFIDRQPDPAGIREALLWQDEHNLHVTDGQDWQRFVAALKPEHDERLVQTMDMTLSHVRFQRGEVDAWWALKQSQRNPDEAWQYAFVEVGPTDRPVPPADVAQESRLLADALAQIAAFARRAPAESGVPPWADGFEHARALLDAAPLPERMSALYGASGMSPTALRLLTAAASADVFGGMGSWNDLGFGDEEEYGRVSAALFERLEPGLLAAVNATTAP